MRALLVAALLAAPVAAAEPDYVDEERARGLVALHARAKHWALQGMVLLSLGPRWHKAASTMVVKALRARDPRQRAFALEALKRTDDSFVRRVADRDVVDALVKAQATTRNRQVAEEFRAVLTRIAPAAAATSRTAWIKWWDAVRDAYEPLRWIEPPAKKKKNPRRTVARAFLKRGFDLQEDGLELVICIDTTGSMQLAIDAARDAVDDTVSLLSAIAPDFKIGLVHYRDEPDLNGGAEVLAKLTRRADAVRRRLAALKADGGGDRAELLEAGLALAFDRRMGWQLRTNKVVVIVGDAPPKSIATALKLVRAARRTPFGKSPTTGATKVRPFVVSAITIGDVREIDTLVREGGGSVARLTAWRRRRPSAANRGTAVVKHLLVQAFGKRWEAQVGDFLRVFQRYRRARYIP